jgi:hypothetical protein
MLVVFPGDTTVSATDVLCFQRTRGGSSHDAAPFQRGIPQYLECIAEMFHLSSEIGTMSEMMMMIMMMMMTANGTNGTDDCCCSSLDGAIHPIGYLDLLD